MPEDQLDHSTEAARAPGAPHGRAGSGRRSRLDRLSQAPAVTTPEWVYWKAELIFLIVLEIAYGVTAFLSAVGCARARFSLLPTSGQGATPAHAGPRAHAVRRPPVQPGPGRGGLRGLDLVVPSLHGRARRRPRNRRSHPTPPRGSHSPCGKSISARISLTRPVTTRSIWSSWEGRAPREFPTTAGCRSARSSPGSFRKRSPAGRST